MTAAPQPRHPGGLLFGQPGAGEQVTVEGGRKDKAALWTEPLQRLALALVRAVSLDDVAAALGAYGTIAAGAGWAHVLLLDHHRRVGVSLLGGPGVPSCRLDELSLEAGTPWNDAVRDGRVLTFQATSEVFQLYPVLEPLLDLPANGPVITTPLVTAGEVQGAVTFGFGSGPGPNEDGTPVGALVGEIAALASQAAARAALHASDHQSAEMLQRAYLPGRLSPLAGLSFATRYLPAGEPMVGGDWYDVIALPGHGHVGIIMGDVAGHGLQAAAVMASLRGGLRAFSTVETCPARMVDRLNGYTCLFKPDSFATAFVAVFDPDEGRLQYARAGHPPAILVDPAGTAHVLDDGLGPPLGVPGASYEAAECEFPAGASLVAFTDGLIERRDEPIDARLADLVRAVAAGAGSEPEGLCDRIVFDLLAGKDLTDDAALLVASRHEERG